MNNSNTIERKAAIVMAWLQIIVGLIILGIAGYRFVNHDYNFKNVNIGVILVLGIFLPLMASGKLIKFKKEKHMLPDYNDELKNENN